MPCFIALTVLMFPVVFCLVRTVECKHFVVLSRLYVTKLRLIMVCNFVVNNCQYYKRLT